MGLEIDFLAPFVDVGNFVPFAAVGFVSAEQGQDKKRQHQQLSEERKPENKGADQLCDEKDQALFGMELRELGIALQEQGH